MVKKQTKKAVKPKGKSLNSLTKKELVEKIYEYTFYTTIAATKKCISHRRAMVEIRDQWDKDIAELAKDITMWKRLAIVFFIGMILEMIVAIMIALN